MATITSAVGEQKFASNEIARNVERIAQMAEQNGEAVQENSAEAAQMEQLARSLHGIVGHFKVMSAHRRHWRVESVWRSCSRRQQVRECRSPERKISARYVPPVHGADTQPHVRSGRPRDGADPHECDAMASACQRNVATENR